MKHLGYTALHTSQLVDTEHLMNTMQATVTEHFSHAARHLITHTEHLITTAHNLINTYRTPYNHTHLIVTAKHLFSPIFSSP